MKLYQHPVSTTSRAILLFAADHGIAARLADRHQRHVCGGAVTLADYLGIALVTLGEAVRTDYTHWRNISRWIATMKSRPGWAAANDAFYTHIVAPRRSDAFATL